MAEIPHGPQTENPINLQTVFEMGNLLSHGLYDCNLDEWQYDHIRDQAQAFRNEALRFRTKDYLRGNLPTPPQAPSEDFKPKLTARAIIDSDDFSYVFLNLATTDSKGSLLGAQGINILDNPHDLNEVTLSFMQVSRYDYKQFVPAREDYEPALLKTVHERLQSLRQKEIEREATLLEDEMLNLRDRKREQKIVHPIHREIKFAPAVPDQSRLARVIPLRRRDQ